MKKLLHALAFIAITTPACLLTAHAFESSIPPEVLASVDGKNITRETLWGYSVATPQFSAALSTPDGASRVLRNLILERLLVLEGERLKIPRDADMNDILYANKVKSTVIPACAAPDDDSLESFFEENKLYFSTPDYLRLERVALRHDEKNTDAVAVRAQSIREQILAGALGFTEAVEKYSEDEFTKARKGDLGFIPDHPTAPMLVFLTALRNAPDGTITELIMEKEYITFYRMTDHREPVAPSFKSVRDDVVNVFLQRCNVENVRKFEVEAAPRWNVKYMVKEVAPWSMQGVAP